MPLRPRDRAEPHAVGLSALAEAERSFDMEDGEREGDEGWRAATWPDAFDRNFARGDLLGSGSFGTVYRCVERASGDGEYAVKVIPKTRDGADPARILMRIREEVRSLLWSKFSTLWLQVPEAHVDLPHTRKIWCFLTAWHTQVDTLKRLQTRAETIRLRGVYEVSALIIALACMSSAC